MKVAIVCDWLLGTGGAERVVLELHRMFPEAPIHTSQYNPDPKLWFGDKWFEDANIQTGWLQKLPKSLKKFLPLLRAWYFSRLDLNKYDLVISASGAEAKFVKVHEGARHIAYIHAPTHYYWARYDDYLKHPGFGFFDPLARLGLKLLVGPMRRWDFRAAQRPDYLIANSNFTREQIKKYYDRDSIVIHPPVDIERFKSHSRPTEKRHGFVTAGRQTPYKRIDLAVEAATMLKVPLIVIGKGPDHKWLKKIAGKSVTFLTKVSDEQIAERFGGAKAFIFPGVDDFGIVAVEAMAAGTPVIAYGAGGALDYVNNKTGVLFKLQTVEALIEALKGFKAEKFNPQEVAKQAEQFSSKAFTRNVDRFINKIMV